MSSNDRGKTGWRTFESTKIDFSIGSVRFSKAQVDCTLLGQRLKWGVVGGPESKQAGLLYLKFFFYQPKDCRLQTASANVGFETPSSPQSGPYILDHWPEQIGGSPWRENVTLDMEANPQIEVHGVGGSAGKISKSRNFSQLHQWHFSLQKHLDGNGRYTVLAWKWEHQKSRNDVPFERPIIAAVVINHEQKPFVIQTEFTGKLVSRRHGFRNLMFSSAKSPGVTLVPENSDSPQDLTKDIEGMRKAIDKENWDHVAIEFPDFRPADDVI